VTTVTIVKIVKLYSKVAKIKVEKRCLSVFNIKGVSEIYDGYSAVVT